MYEVVSQFKGLKKKSSNAKVKIIPFFSFCTIYWFSVCFTAIFPEEVAAVAQYLGLDPSSRPNWDWIVTLLGPFVAHIALLNSFASLIFIINIQNSEIFCFVL